MTNTIALITGANRGLGYETARLLAERGMTVFLGCRDEARAESAATTLRTGGHDARPLHLDVTDEKTIQAATETIERTHGRLDVLVNNAGIGGFAESGAPSDTPLAAIRRVYEINVFGVVAVTNAMLPLLRRAPAARIVNVSSEVGSLTTMTTPGSPLAQLQATVPYPSSKSALNMLTVMYARELADTQILVNAANPGYCATDFNGNSGHRTAEAGASVSVDLATLDADGPNGLLWGDQSMSHHTDTSGPLPW